MKRAFLVLILVTIGSGCQSPAPSTPAPATPAFQPSSPVPSPSNSSTATRPPTPQPSRTVRPSPPTPTSVPTSTWAEGWFVFQNDLLGYEFSYPPEAEVSSIGPDGYSPDDVPPDFTLNGKPFNYFEVLGNLYPDDLCVGVSYETGFITIQAPPNRGGKFVTCGVTGVGDYDIVEKSETITIGGQPETATGLEVRERDAAATFHNEFFFAGLADGTRINYGGSGTTYESDLSVKEVLHQILASYHALGASPSCAANWTQLYPGIFAVAAGEPGAPLNGVLSAPSADASSVTQLQSGEAVLVLEGPICADDLVFWKVASDAIPSGSGWTAEGNGMEYSLVPYNP